MTHLVRYVEFAHRGGSVVEVNSEMGGWDALLRTVDEHLQPLVEDIPGAVTALDRDDPELEIARAASSG